ncbi:hypothetical protein JXO59_11800 [candidate division KSB1 bacterium]|nr:hypothetical protein [candidate division KSB1 bacterium]
MRNEYILPICIILFLPLLSITNPMDNTTTWMQDLSGVARAAGSNTLKVRDAFAMSGQQITIHVDVKNDDPFHNYQFDLVLPSCLTVLTGTIQLTERAQDQSINWNLIGGNTYRFIALSTSKSPFIGNSGPILRLTCQVSGTSGSYALTPQGITLLNASWQNILTGSSGGIFTIFTQPARLRLKAWLEGWYNSGWMRTDLRTFGALPWTSPYPQAVRTASSLPFDIAEWGLLELRTTLSGDPVYYQSYLWKSNGQLCEMDGSTIDLTLNIPAGSYYILLHHRNHASVMSATPQSLSSGSVFSYDFSLASTQYYGQGGKSLGGGVYGLPCGDINNDAFISSRDYVVWYHRMILLPSAGYYDEDINGDQYVNNDDFILWQTNARAGLQSQVP